MCYIWDHLAAEVKPDLCCGRGIQLLHYRKYKKKQVRTVRLFFHPEPNLTDDGPMVFTVRAKTGTGICYGYKEFSNYDDAIDYYSFLVNDLFGRGWILVENYKIGEKL